VRVPSIPLLLLLTTCAPPSRAQQSSAPLLQPGTLLPKVVAVAAPGQSYALYLPSNYSAAKRWPIVYIFDPGAHGEIPGALMQPAAEQFGYIIAASNNSKNGPLKPDALAAQAIWKDTHTRFSIDDQRVYFAGLSGGARVASHLAQLCNCTQAVFLSGAGFSTDSPPSNRDTFAVFFTVGLLDFNYPELVHLDAQLESLNTPHFLRRFSGGHQWAPAEIWPEAFAWADLLAMKAKHRERNDAFTSTQLANFTAAAQKFEQDGDLYFSWQFLRATSAAFAGLSDMSALQARIATLGDNPAVRGGQKREKQELTEQEGLEDTIYKAFAPIASSDERNDVVQQTTQEIVRLRERAAHEKNADERRVLERARRAVFAYFLEGGEPLLDSGDLRLARIYITLAAETRPEAAWPQVSLARCDLKMGHKKDALRDLQKAVAIGFTAADLAQLPSDYPEFVALASDPEFQKLTANAPDKSASP
jgi:hypothetical protein